MKPNKPNKQKTKKAIIDVLTRCSSPPQGNNIIRGLEHLVKTSVIPLISLQLKCFLKIATYVWNIIT